MGNSSTRDNRETTDRPDLLPVCFIIFDEAQNATRKQVFDVISRADQETKVVLTGDINQVDNLKLNPWNNGLAYAIQTMRGKGVAIVHFEAQEVVRS